ncbi:hypothetical protein [Bradyrhizobium sp. 44]|uniref:HORMA-1 domain-containing protein n=1 Tax=Bradyrhizobium sp. 44 TaxID=2782675 RepID=UPI001FF82D32|nr:hypothetical protein [Bradyrhizobium sp. 44]
MAVNRSVSRDVPKCWRKGGDSTQYRHGFKAGLPFSRGGAPEPGISGYLSSDRTYSSGGRALDRATVRSF